MIMLLSGSICVGSLKFPSSGDNNNDFKIDIKYIIKVSSNHCILFVSEIIGKLKYRTFRIDYK